MKKLLLITDAWFPQTNGVVTTISHLKEKLDSDYEVIVIHPGMFDQVSITFYPEISLAFPKRLWKKIDKIKPDYIHIFTEGPIGLAAKSYCLKNKIKHTTSFHTNFALLLNQMLYWPEDMTWAMTKYFHSTSDRVLVTNEGMKSVLLEKGFSDNLVVWNRGVNRSNFFYKEKKRGNELNILCVSRVSKEKNIKDFCGLSEISKHTYNLVGAGPELEKMKKKFPKVNYSGKIDQEDLNTYYHSSDAFFFPSRFDTFGIVMIESFACGTPVVAYNEVAPKGLIIPGVNGYTVDSIKEVPEALLEAAKLPRNKVYDTSIPFSWKNVADIFVSNIAQISN